ncbi:MAG TPA: acyltransferase [Chloroflexota bacterium]
MMNPLAVRCCAEAARNPVRGRGAIDRIGQKLRLALDRPVLIWWSVNARLSPLRHLRLQLEARLHGGTVTCAPSALIMHRTRFQGQGRLVVSDHASFGYPLAGQGRSEILIQPRDPGSEIRIGEGSAIMNGSELMARTSIAIGQHCRIGPATLIVDSDFHGISPDERDLPGRSEPVVIGDNVWTGTRVTILKGVTIGRDTIVAAATVVTKDVPEGAIAAGNPMRIVGSAYGPRSE